MLTMSLYQQIAPAAQCPQRETAGAQLADVPAATTATTSCCAQGTGCSSLLLPTGLQIPKEGEGLTGVREGAQGQAWGEALLN